MSLAKFNNIFCLQNEFKSATVMIIMKMSPRAAQRLRCTLKNTFQIHNLTVPLKKPKNELIHKSGPAPL